MGANDVGNNLYVYSASAGAGKTTTITREYIRLALSRRNNYKHIQAVTFTNKATAEMKKRILDELYNIASDLPINISDEDLKKLRKAISPTGDPNDSKTLREEAKHCLRSMLIDYESFRISTIDAFFQEILRSFARELNLSGSFRIELESKDILKKACQAVLVDEQNVRDSKVLQWVTQVWLEEFRRGENYLAEKIISKLSEELLRDKVREIYAPKSGGGELSKTSFPSMESVERLKEAIEAYNAEFFRILNALSEEIFRLVSPATERGIEFKQSGIIFRATRHAKHPSDIAKTRFYSRTMQAVWTDPRNLYTKGNIPTVNALLDFDAIGKALSQYEEFIKNELSILFSNVAISKQLPSLGLLSAIDTKIKEIQKNTNSLLLADAPSLIRNILEDEGGVPFLYERLGSQIKHHMIDEFQDTSVVQYRNFKPLLDDSLSSGEPASQESIIVGDVKQSIYRWRNSDSTLLSSLGQETQWRIVPKSLGDNWRSAKNIINFNNNLYEYLSGRMKQHFEELLSAVALSEEQKERLTTLVNILRTNYQGAEQNPKREATGYVCLHRFAYEAIKEHEGEGDASWDDSDEMSEHNAQEVELPLEARLKYQLPMQIRHIVNRGYKLGDIAILVRTNAQASYIAKILLDAETKEGEFDFISEDALAPTEAVSVNFVMATLHYIIEPESIRCRENLSSLYRVLCGEEFPDEEFEALTNNGRKSLYETLELIIARYKALIDKGECPYLVKLLDTALAFQQDLSVDIADFIGLWREKGSSLRLSMAQNDDKMQIMTIHKSKGLDFPVVLIPFLYIDLTPKGGGKSNFLWCDNPFAEESGISKVPIGVSSSLLRTQFAADYLEECILTSLDALNMLYVATTRAKDEMHLWLIDDAFKAKEQLKKLKLPDETEYYHTSITGFLLDELSREGALEIKKYYTELQYNEEDSYSLKKDSPKTSGEHPNQRLVIEGLESYDISGRIEELREGLVHFERERRRNYGNLMHSILSHIERSKDCERALQIALRNGELKHEDMAQVRESLDKLLAHPVAQQWFDGTGTILNESAILGVERVFRPDRVISYGDKDLAVIVDYKFGKALPRYRKQVEGYAKLLKEMGYKRVDAYLWYLSQENEEQPLLGEDIQEPQLVCSL